MSTATFDFIHDLKFRDAPAAAQVAARMALLDLLGVAAAGTATQLSRIIREHAVECFASHGKGSRIMFDGRRCSAPGAALAGGMQIDSIDAHDGHKLTKGHIGCGVLPAVLAFCEQNPDITGHELMSMLLLGYEVGVRAGISLHDSACDYHTSGAWVALACAAIGARAQGLDVAQTREALGIAEYHGPRSQMMRTIDHPSMIKDGSGWGSMAGVSAAVLARQGFTGAPALTLEAPEAAPHWADIGQRWMVQEQYVKAYPVCRWAQPAIAAVLAMQAEHRFNWRDLAQIQVETFHQAARLASREPASTEAAQYSLPFPVAAALVHGDVGVEHIDGDGLQNSDVLQLSRLIEMIEVEEFNAAFPARRISAVKLVLENGGALYSGPTEAAGDPEQPFSAVELEAKFMKLASPALGEFGAVALKDEALSLDAKPSLSTFNALVYKKGNFK